MATTNTIAKQMMINRPKIYDKISSPALFSALPNFNLLLQNKYTMVPNNSTTLWRSLNGKVFTQFAKAGPQCKRDLWDDFVAPYYKSAINCETWRNGAGGRISSICGSDGIKDTPYDVLEVDSVQIGTWPVWKGTNDHSKWAVANPNYPNGYAASRSEIYDGYAVQEEDNSPAAGPVTSNDIASIISSFSNFSCVGDVNRMCSQETRGGGALCTVDSSLWLAFNRTIVALER
jgi:deoxyribonuclease-2